MNRNRKCSNKLAAGLAVGMAAIMTAVPVYAAEEYRVSYPKKKRSM